jgi:DNA-binding beta-propeller fold protein YncE
MKRKALPGTAALVFLMTAAALVLPAQEQQPQPQQPQPQQPLEGQAEEPADQQQAPQEPSQSDGIDMEQVYAEREFRFGVRAFHDGTYGKAIMSFEEALSYKPGFTRARQWLAEAYHRAGYERTALEIWNGLIESGEASAALENAVETLRYRRGLREEDAEEPNYVQFHSIASEETRPPVFSRPTSVRAAPDGGFYLVSFATNEVVKFSANGTIDRRLGGGLEGLNHPFDLVQTEDGRLFVSEFGGDRIVSMNRRGRDISRFGGSGTDEGNLLGPQFIADGGDGYIYVTDQGNRRVVKFSYDGEYVLSFGERGQFFSGFRNPTGVIVYRDRVFVTDKQRGDLSVFDTSGNYIRSFGMDVLESPEGISLYREGELLIADERRIYRYLVEDEQFLVLKRVDDRQPKLLKAERDINENLLVADFRANLLRMMADFSQMYSGLSVDILGVESERFPRVAVDLQVTRRDGDPYVGLAGNNFFVTEGRYPVGDHTLELAVDELQRCELTFMVERSPAMRQRGEAISRVAAELVEALQGEGTVNVVAASDQPVIALEDAAGAEAVHSAAVDGSYSERWKFDSALRLAGSTLTSSRSRRAVVFLSTGTLPPHAFDEYELATLVQFLKNNDISFYCISVSREGENDEELRYLSEKSGGQFLDAYRPEGIGSLVGDLRRRPTGRYTLSFSSSQEPDFGRAYLPVEVQVSIFGRSGRDEAGYYGPPEM